MNKYLLTILTLGTVLGSGKAFASDCVSTPDCATLGYDKNVSDCLGTSLKCPWDLTKASCDTCNIANCKACVSGQPDRCQECESGYIGLFDLNSGKILECTKKPTHNCNVVNCTTCVEGDANTCQLCDPGYTRSSGKCVFTYDCQASHVKYSEINSKMGNTLLRNSCTGYHTWSTLAPIQMGETCQEFNTRMRNSITDYNNNCPDNKISTINSIRCNSCCNGGSNGLDALYMCSDDDSGGILAK